ncbi:MAG: hypothetical protein J6X03_02555, partial [Bacilli bacterium]|nr:hypothetical protein [Bacilli bacterium]
MKKIMSFILLFFLFCSISKVSLAADDGTVEALDSLQNHIVEMSHKINAASSQMMMLADLMICNAKHGKESYHEFSIGDIISFSIHIIQPWLFLSGLILYILGFFILMIASFYMFDVV